MDILTPDEREVIEMLEMVWAIDDLVQRLRPFLTIKEEAQLQAIRDWLKARTAR